MQPVQHRFLFHGIIRLAHTPMKPEYGDCVCKVVQSKAIKRNVLPYLSYKAAISNP